MKINSIKSYLNSDNFAKNACYVALSAFTLGVAVSFPILNKRSEERMADMKKFVLEHDSLKYKTLNENQADYDTWYQETQKIQDSLNIESKVKTSYTKGLQAVRDSIARGK